MKTVYKVFLIVFILIIAINLYGIQWHLGFMHEDNTINIFSLDAAIMGLLVVFVLDSWSKLSSK